MVNKGKKARIKVITIERYVGYDLWIMKTVWPETGSRRVEIFPW